MKLFSGDDKGRVVFSSLDLDQVISQRLDRTNYYYYVHYFDHFFYKIAGKSKNACHNLSLTTENSTNRLL